MSILQDALVSCEQLGLDFDTVFANTNTSYEPDEKGRSSGKTGSDIERILAFHAIGRKRSCCIPARLVRSLEPCFINSN